MLNNVKFKTFKELNEKFNITELEDKICENNWNLMLYGIFDDWFLEKALMIGEGGEFEFLWSLTYNKVVYEYDN